MSPKEFHSAYRDAVLHPDFRFARQHLAQHFLDAMIAHVRTVERLPDPQVQAHQEDIARLGQALMQLRERPLPDYAADVPDLYFAFNRILEAELGPQPVGFLRMGLSRNDLDMTVYKMRTRELLLSIMEDLARLRQALLEQAEAHRETIFIAQTHHQPGQPTTVAHYLSAIDGALARDHERLLAAFCRLNTCPLGSAALAGSSHHLDRPYTAGLLGFDAAVANTYDAVASSDWQVEYVGCAQNLALTLSRFVCDLLIWASEGFFVLADGLVQGSSIMPQKRNPVALEHARTRFSRTLGSGQMVLYSSHNIPYADLNDFGPDIQGALVSLHIQLEGGLALLTACLEGGSFDRKRLEKQVRCTDTTATELADVLTREHGLSFQEGHRLAGELVLRLCRDGRNLQDATVADLVALGGPRMDEGVLQRALDPHTFVARRDGFGGPAPAVMAEHLRHARHSLDATVATLKETRQRLSDVRRNLSLGREKT